MSGIQTPRFRVTDLEMWGRLIKSWATRLDYVSQTLANQPPRINWVNPTWPGTVGTKPSAAAVDVRDVDGQGNPRDWCLPPMTPVNIPRPDGSSVALPNAVAMTVAEFSACTAAAGIPIAEMPTQYKHVVIVQGDKDTMVMRLPPKDTLQGSEDDLLNGVDYKFPGFYTTYFGTPGTPLNFADKQAIMRLHANRIGEYTLNNCI